MISIEDIKKSRDGFIVDGVKCYILNKGEKFISVGDETICNVVHTGEPALGKYWGWSPRVVTETGKEVHGIIVTE